MFDRWEYTIPADTAEADAIRVKCPITKGFLRRLVVYHPAGCHNLARSRIFVGERPIAPRSPSNYIAAEDMPVIIEYLNEPVWDDMPVLNWDVWNLDETNDHTIWMSAEWISEEKPHEMKMVTVVEDLANLLKQFIGL